MAAIREEVIMRSFIAWASLAMIAAPVAAAPADEDRYTIPPELTDPAMAETLGKVLASMTKAMMDMPVGGLQAAVEGREATAEEKGRTLRDMAGRDPDVERRIESQVAQAVPRMQAGMKAMASSLPGMMKALEKAAEDMEAGIGRATANLPQPGYPKR
jgi:hypothetical protein